MVQATRTVAQCAALSTEETVVAPHRVVHTLRGPVFLQDCCPSWVVEHLRADGGLRAFARRPEREHALLLGLAQRSDCSLALAYTATGEIIGQVTIAPADAWWKGLEDASEIAVEVSSGWRRLGIAHELLSLVFERQRLEDRVMLGLGFSWHWDMEGLEIDRFRYRQVVERLFAPFGFVEYLTSEPNIRMDPANILLARLGSSLDQETINQFFNCLLQSDTLPGL